MAARPHEGPRWHGACTRAPNGGGERKENRGRAPARARPPAQPLRRRARRGGVGSQHRNRAGRNRFGRPGRELESAGCSKRLANVFLVGSENGAQSTLAAAAKRHQRPGVCGNRPAAAARCAAVLYSGCRRQGGARAKRAKREAAAIRVLSRRPCGRGWVGWKAERAGAGPKRGSLVRSNCCRARCGGRARAGSPRRAWQGSAEARPRHGRVARVAWAAPRRGWFPSCCAARRRASGPLGPRRAAL